MLLSASPPQRLAKLLGNTSKNAATPEQGKDIQGIIMLL